MSAQELAKVRAVCIRDAELAGARGDMRGRLEAIGRLVLVIPPAPPPVMPRMPTHHCRVVMRLAAQASALVQAQAEQPAPVAVDLVTQANLICAVARVVKQADDAGLVSP